jgi:hypothetical protein
MTVLVILAASGPLGAQVIAPPPPAEYDAIIRYRIRADRNERIRQFLELTRFLASAGFQREPTETDDALDPNAERFHGKLPSSAVRQILTDPRVRSVLLVPAGYHLPEGEVRVPVRIELASGLPRERQQLLHLQAIDRLQKLGFIEKVGYDTRNSTRLVGTIPASSISHLTGDLRWQPSGWFSPENSPNLLPEPIRSIDPLRIIEVLPEPDGIASAPDVAPLTVDPTLSKLSPDLRALLNEEGAANKPTRMEVVLFDPPAREDLAWRAWIRSVGEVTIEGHAGQLVTVLAPAGMAKEFARMPQVATVRLPIAASPGITTGGLVNASDALSLTHLNSLHAQNGLGQGICIAIVDSDFAGVQRAVSRSLPNAKLVDLTAERNPNLEPDPIRADRPGRGTLAALAAVRAAPNVELILVRVDDAAPYQVLSIARAAAGEVFRTEAMNIRYAELLLDNERLRQSRARLNDERRAIMEVFTSDEETQKRRVEVQQRLEGLDKEEREYSNRLARFIALERNILDLHRISAVACSLNWSEGLPTDGNGPLAMYLDGPARLSDRVRKLGPLTWLQSAGDTNGQTWAAPLWDADNNGVLEFAQRNFPLPAGKWTRELNFIGWQPHDGAWSADLPVGAKVRLALQWTEAHDSIAPVDPLRYREPLTKLMPMILKQRDPSGSKLPSDDMIVVARAVPLPMLISRSANSATYEHVIELAVDTPGRYAVRIEGRAADGTAPPDVALIPAARRVGEVYPRLSVAVADEKSQSEGRPIFIDFRTVAGGMGSPNDAGAVVVVGALGAQGKPQTYSAKGSAPSLALIPRPSVMTFDEFNLGNVSARGTATANGFVAGTVAAMLSAGAPPSSDLRWLRILPGGTLQVPSAWLQQRLNATELRERSAFTTYQRNRYQ